MKKSNMIKNKIPKTIHYCWFGKSKKNELILKCIESWKKYLPDYKIIEWNEENFDVYSNQYTKEAYENKKWAFVSDYVRLYVLYNHGGIYFDTDVEVTRNIDEFLKYPIVMGFHAYNAILTAVIGAEKNNDIIKQLFDMYVNKQFVIDGKCDMQTNNELLTNLLVRKFGLNLNNKNQNLNNRIYVFNECYFSRKKDGKDNYTIHHGDGSWYSNEKIITELKAYKKYYKATANMLNYVLEGKKINSILVDKKVAIYGNGELGHIAVKVLEHNNINLICIIDKNENFKSYNSIPIITLKDLSNYDVDCIIITPIPYIEYISEQLKHLKNIKVISVEEIFEDKRL